jgi:collagenase-like PrtC family protease
MTLRTNEIELLSPAKTVEIGREAILHGADAVYIGGPSFGARHNASNEISEIAKLVEYAHKFHARIFVTLNTILHDNELEPARKLIHQFYDAGVDALIVQDMGVMELDIPPIQIHASTQCDIRTPEKAHFLGASGFSQLVLARELTIEQIKAIKAQTNTPLEYFVHGALCVAYSGQCYISHADNGRSANRGDCSQACRLPYTLTDSENRVVAFDKHLLSMKDNDQSRNLEALLDAGVQSLKIEGRYKDMGYVKNITAHYRLLLDEILTLRPEYYRASSGHSDIAFTPNVDKNFHRGHTDYFATGRKIDVAAFDSPKFVGLHLGYVTRLGPEWFELESQDQLANGDGLNYMHKREVVGLQANVVEKIKTSENGTIWRIFPNEKMAEIATLKVGMSVHRNRDQQWEHALTKKSADRKLGLWMTLKDDAQGLILSLNDAEGICTETRLDMNLVAAEQSEKAEQNLREQLSKLGSTIFYVEQLDVQCKQAWFVPSSAINALRRDACAKHETARQQQWQRPLREAEEQPLVPYPESTLSYLANVYNHKARAFYQRHGVTVIAKAYEAKEEAGEVSLMITKHCLRFSYNLCPKQAKGVTGVQGQVKAEPMTLTSGDEQYTLRFDCKPCEMHVMGAMKPHILKAPPPSTVSSPLVFHKARPV